MWRALILLAAGSLAVGCGCGKGEPDRPPKPIVQVDPSRPEDTLFEQLRAGAFQIAGVIESLDAAVEKLKSVELGKDEALKSAIADISEAIDSAGAALSDYSEEPDRVRLAKVFPEYDERRIRGIDAANDALHDLEDASATAAGIAAEKGLAALSEVVDLLDLATEDIRGAIEALGGKVERAAST